MTMSKQSLGLHLGITVALGAVIANMPSDMRVAVLKELRAQRTFAAMTLSKQDPVELDKQSMEAANSFIDGLLRAVEVRK